MLPDIDRNRSKTLPFIRFLDCYFLPQIFRTSYGNVVELAGSVLDWEENPFTKNLQIDPSIFNDHLCWVYIKTSQWGQSLFEVTSAEALSDQYSCQEFWWWCLLFWSEYHLKKLMIFLATFKFFSQEFWSQSSIEASEILRDLKQEIQPKFMTIPFGIAGLCLLSFIKEGNKNSSSISLGLWFWNYFISCNPRGK